MSDPTPTPASTANDEIQAALHKIDDMFHGHKTYTDDQIQTIKNELKQLVADTQAADKAERDELKGAVKELLDHMATQRKAADESAAARKAESTIVVPPSTLNPSHEQQGAVNAPSDPEHHEPEKKGFLDGFFSKW